MNEIAVVKTIEPTTRKTSVRSSVSYPYFDLTDSITVARVIHENRGTSCTPDQLASELKYKSTLSGTYQTRVSAAKQFGLVRSDNGDIYVTDRARTILAPVFENEAKRLRVEAFLEVNLFKLVYEKFKGTTLPSKMGLRNLFISGFGISEDRADPAIRVFMDSAMQAAMFPNDDQSRLVVPTFLEKADVNKPPLHSPDTTLTHKEENRKISKRDDFDKEGGQYHPFIQGLLQKLPNPDSEWSLEARKKWLTTAENIFGLMYTHSEDENENFISIQIQ